MPLLGVVFDFDGVIADTEALHLRAYQETLAERGLLLSETEYLERYLGYDDVGVVTAVGRDHGVVLEDSEITRLIETKGHRFESLVGTNHVLFAGSAECIRRLASQTTLAIASGALHDEIDRILTTNALRQYFEGDRRRRRCRTTETGPRWISAGRVSSQSGPRKDALPELLRRHRGLTVGSDRRARGRAQDYRYHQHLPGVEPDRRRRCGRQPRRGRLAIPGCTMLVASCAGRVGAHAGVSTRCLGMVALPWRDAPGSNAYGFL